MKIKLLFVVVFSVFFSWITVAQQHQHVVAATTIIDGSQHPEQIPDSAAFRMWFLTVSVLPNATEKNVKIQNAHLAKLQLANETDRVALQGTVNDFRSQYVALIEQYNTTAKTTAANGNRQDLTSFLQQRDDLVDATRAALGLRLSAQSVASVNAAVQAHKKFVRLTIPK